MVLSQLMMGALQTKKAPLVPIYWGYLTHFCSTLHFFLTSSNFLLPSQISWTRQFPQPTFCGCTSLAVFSIILARTWCAIKTIVQWWSWQRPEFLKNISKLYTPRSKFHPGSISPPWAPALATCPEQKSVSPEPQGANHRFTGFLHFCLSLFSFFHKLDQLVFSAVCKILFEDIESGHRLGTLCFALQVFPTAFLAKRVQNVLIHDDVIFCHFSSSFSNKKTTWLIQAIWLAVDTIQFTVTVI